MCNYIIFQSLLPLVESNLVKTAMSIFDCFVEEFTDEKGMEEVTSLDLRAQLEVINCFSWHQMNYDMS